MGGQPKFHSLHLKVIILQCSTELKKNELKTVQCVDKLTMVEPKSKGLKGGHPVCNHTTSNNQASHPALTVAE